MKKKFSILDLRLPINPESAPPRFFPITNRKSQIANAFTLIEVMVVVALLSLIVIALMTVFNATQSAFRASVTQTDVLEGGRAVMDLMAGDLKEMAPSLGDSNNVTGAVNFYVAVANSPGPMPLTASSLFRTNVLENFFILSSGNQNGVPMWFGTGYAVYLSPTNLYSLYRFSTNRPMASVNAVSNLFYADFGNFLKFPNNYSHLIDGVVGLRARAFDDNGYWMTNTLNFAGGQTTNKNILFLPPAFGETGFYMFSNTLPASVEIEMATLEDRTLQRAVSIPILTVQSNYLAQQAGKVHIFRQRISIPNAAPSAYQ